MWTNPQLLSGRPLLVDIPDPFKRRGVAHIRFARRGSHTVVTPLEQTMPNGGARPSASPL